MTPSERVLWRWIRRDRLGFRFRRQHPAGYYVLDFYCAEARLCVEVDGDSHEGREARDKRRDEWVEEQGIRTIRFASDSVFADLGTILYKIRAACEEGSGRDAFPQGEEGLGREP